MKPAVPTQGASARRRVALLLTCLLPTAACELDLEGEEDLPTIAETCALMSAPVYHRVRPSNQASLFTRSATEAANAASLYGYTENHGTPFKAAASAAAGLAPVHRLYKASSGDFLWTISE